MDQGRISLMTDLTRRSVTNLLVYIRGVNNSEKSVRRFLELKKSCKFPWNFGIFLPNFLGFWDFGLKNFGIFSDFFGNIEISTDFYEFF